MKLITRYIPSLIALLLMAAVGVFYYVCYPYHLHYYEQTQMFQFSTDYWLETASLPGGLADYVGRFLAQFFHIGWAGAALMALLFGVLYAASWRAVGRCLSGSVRLLAAALLLLPVRFLWVFACDENAMPALFVAMTASLLVVSLLHLLHHRAWRWALTAVSYLLLYWAAGPMAVLILMLMAVHEAFTLRGLQRLLWPVVWLVLALITPPMVHHWVNWPLSNLYLGIHYFRFSYIQLPLIWEAAGALVLLDVLLRLLQRRPKWLDGLHPLLVGFGSLTVMVLLMWMGVKRAYRPNTEVAMKYDALVLEGRWGDILTEAQQRMPKHPGCVQCINLAMAMTGQMGDMLFRAPQQGTETLLPQHTLNFSRPLTAGIIYYNVGWVNTAQRFVCEAQEAIPDYQKSARCYQLLAKTHLVRGEKALARKYLKKLQQTLFYADWAEEQLRLMASTDAKAFSQHSEYGPLMRGAVRDDYFFSPDILNMLGNYCTTTPHNRVATQYLLSVALVQRQLSTFAECYQLSQYFEAENHVPLYFQQALALHWWLQHHSLEGITYRIDAQVLEHLRQFLSDREAGLPVQAMQQRYFFTYWYHYFSSPNIAENEGNDDSPKIEIN